MDLATFNLDNEIKAVVDYVSATWEGFLPGQIDALVQKSFMAGWDDFQFAQAHPLSEQLEARMRIFNALGLPTESLRDDLLAQVLVVAIVACSSVYIPSHDKRVKGLVNDLRFTLGSAVSAVVPISMAAQDQTGQALLVPHCLFEGLDTADRYARSFATSISAQSVVYDSQSQRRSPLTTLVGSIYAQGAGLRKLLNTATLERDLKLIDVSAPLCLRTEELRLPDNPILRHYVLDASTTIAQEGLEKIIWCATSTPAEDLRP